MGCVVSCVTVNRNANIEVLFFKTIKLCNMNADTEIIKIFN